MEEDKDERGKERKKERKKGKRRRMTESGGGEKPAHSTVSLNSKRHLVIFFSSPVLDPFGREEDRWEVGS